MQKITKTIPTVIRRARADEGATALEFAMISPVLLLMVFGIIEVALIFYVASTLESATINTSRLGKTGFIASGISREQTLRDMLASRVGDMIDVSQVVITSKSYPSFDTIGDQEPFLDTNGNGVHDGGETYDDINGNGEWDTDMGSEGLGDANDVVVYTITYPWHISTPIIGDIITESGIFNVRATAVVKNEPYNVADDQIAMPEEE